MKIVSEILTERLLLRRWKATDSEPFFKINSDPEVMEHFRKTSTREETDDFIQKIETHFDEKGFGLWVMETLDTKKFVGFTGLYTPQYKTHFTPCVEVGWRMAKKFWGKGYATEAARASLDAGFNKCGLNEILSFTVPANLRSIAVMERIGMKYSGEFDHPNIPEGHHLKKHVIYKIQK